MVDRLVRVADRLMSWLNPRRLAVLVLAVVLIVSAIFTPLVRAADNKIDNSSRLVTFYDEGEEHSILTKSRTVGEALDEVGLRIGDKDSVTPAVDSELNSSIVVVNIRRARPVTIADENGQRIRTVTAEIDATKIIESVGITLNPRDEIEVEASANFMSSGGAGQEISIRRAKTVNLSLYGQRLTLYTQADTLAEMLSEAGIGLADDDTTSLPLDQEISDGMSAQIWRNGIQTIEQEEEVAFETEIIKDSTKQVGYTEVQTAGQPGKKTVIYQVNMQSGVELSREKISEVITVPAVTQVEIHGTKVNLPPGSHTDWMRMAGIPESDFGATNYIISRESGWRYNATNASSGAYGLPQALPGYKMRSAGEDWETNPITQLKWFYSYCTNRYGSVQEAYEFWLANHWY